MSFILVVFLHCSDTSENRYEAWFVKLCDVPEFLLYARIAWTSFSHTVYSHVWSGSDSVSVLDSFTHNCQLTLWIRVRIPPTLPTISTRVYSLFPASHFSVTFTCFHIFVSLIIYRNQGVLWIQYYSISLRATYRSHDIFRRFVYSGHRCRLLWAMLWLCLIILIISHDCIIILHSPATMMKETELSHFYNFHIIHQLTLIRTQFLLLIFTLIQYFITGFAYLNNVIWAMFICW